MFVNKIPFMITISRGIKMGTVDNIASTKVEVSLQSIKQVMKLYKIREFVVNTLLLYGNFSPLTTQFSELGVTLNLVVANKHIPKVERYTRIVKERTRAICHITPYKKCLHILSLKWSGVPYILTEILPSTGWGFIEDDPISACHRPYTEFQTALPPNIRHLCPN